MESSIIRVAQGNNSTLSHLYLNGIFQCYLLEDKIREVKIPKQTAIPTGVFKLVVNTWGGMNVDYGRIWGDMHQGMIEIDGHWSGSRLELTIRDTGSHAFVRPDVIKPPNIFDFPESGWGIYIVHQVMDSVKYERFAGHNQWSLAKQFSR